MAHSEVLYGVGHGGTAYDVDVGGECCSCLRLHRTGKRGPTILSGKLSGTPLPTMVCDVVAEDSTLIGWRNETTCWVFHPVPNRSF